MAVTVPRVSCRVFARIVRVSLLVAVTAACLPRGEPPAGTQLLTGRSALLVGLAPANGDGLLRILLMRPGSTSNLANLSVVALDADNHLSPEVLLVPDIDPVFTVNCSGGLAACQFDATGRFEVDSHAEGPVMVNPITGDVQPVPPFGQPQAVPGQRSYLFNSQTSGTLVDADGHTTAIQLAPPPPNVFTQQYRFLGDDFYYLDPQHNLIDIPTTDVPEQVATNVTYFSFWNTTGNPVLVFTRTTADGSGTQSSIGDPRSGMETVIPFDVATATMSPDQRWVLDIENQMYGKFSFFDRTSGAQQTVDVGQPAQFGEWRPGTSEAWIMAVLLQWRDPGTVWILRPDAPTVSVPDASLFVVNTNGIQSGSNFTADGTYWYSTTARMDSGTSIYQVGAADDPTGPRYDLNPPATFNDGDWYLPNGKFLSTNYVKDYDRADANLLDPRTGQTRLVGERGRVATVGQTRFMGIFHLEELRGDLVTGGFEDASPTKLASEFTEGAFAEPQGTDLLAPGTRIVYQFQARAASPYDGIWVVNCP